MIGCVAGVTPIVFFLKGPPSGSSGGGGGEWHGGDGGGGGVPAGGGVYCARELDTCRNTMERDTAYHVEQQITIGVVGCDRNIIARAAVVERARRNAALEASTGLVADTSHNHAHSQTSALIRDIPEVAAWCDIGRVDCAGLQQ